MKKLLKQVRGRKQIVFLDLEGTQFSHETIAIGAVKASLNPDGTVKKFYPGFKKYVLAKHNVGRLVEELTGITSDLLAKEGVGFEEALPLLKKYIGTNFSKSRFVTFGSHDVRILKQSLLYTPEANHGIVTTIIKNHLDLSTLISEYVKDDKNNPLSLTNLCKLFEIPMIEPAHDPLNDALLLGYLYNELFKKTNIIKERYASVLLNINNVPRPIKKALQKIKDGGSITAQDIYQYLEEEIDS